MRLTKMLGGVLPGLACLLVSCGSGPCPDGQARHNDGECRAVETDLEICGDDSDNDGDGFVDCADQDCATDPGCAGDDDTGDDDDSAGDDDTGDDDTGDDADSAGDDDDSAGDDDDSAGDDDTGDDDSEPPCTDADADNWCLEEGDCDDSAPQTNPLGVELCDGSDNDCDGQVDEDSADADTWYLDADNDGYGAAHLFVEACTAAAGYVDNALDCDDLNAQSYPGAVETCDQQDNNCDGIVDEGAAAPITWYGDSDGDGFGDNTVTALACAAPVGYSLYGGDCDDSDATFHPGAAEADCTDPADYNCDSSTGYVDADSDGHAACEDCNDNDAAVNTASSEACDGVDNDCNGQVDEAGATGETSWYLDADGDGYGRTTAGVVACAAPPGYIATSGDCDDLDASSFPSGTEVCDGADNNCDGTTDEGVTTTFYSDADSDGYGDLGSPQQSCFAPIGAVVNSLDCDDGSPAVHPGGVELCDGLDNDCNSSIDDGAVDAVTWYPDADGDGYGTSAGSVQACQQPAQTAANNLDCDDTQSSISPGGTEVCDGIDNDCALGSDNGLDGDGDGVTPCGPDGVSGTNDDDCDDSNAAVSPNSSETCDGNDTDCDGIVDNGVAGGLSQSCPAANCLAILNANAGSNDGLYWLDPDGSGSFEAFCDMTQFGGGWTLVARMTNGCNTFSRSSVGTLTSPAQSACAKLSDARINALDGSAGSGGVYWGWHDGSPYALLGPKFLKIVTGEFNADATQPNLVQQCSCSPTGPFSPSYDYHSTMAGVYTHNGGWECVTIGEAACTSANTNSDSLFLYQHALRQAGTFPSNSHGISGGQAGYLFLR